MSTELSATDEAGALSMNDWYDQLTVALIEQICEPDANTVDIGAGAGDILRHLLRVAPRGRHVAVEALPSYAEGLRRDFPGVTVVAAAAAERTGRDSFVHVVSNPGYSGLRRRPYDRPDETLRELTVDTVRLDDVLPGDRRIDLVKVDTEGGEVLALRGAVELLRRWRPVIVFEHGGDHAMREYGTTSADLWALLVTELGYELRTLPGRRAGQPALDRAGFADALREHWYFVADRPSPGPAGGSGQHEPSAWQKGTEP
ncbi:FkbM family methyltransferase [Micromonospora sp. ATCC 39149]|uniref:FkbM family methyltransferase n=1 Tax=Micromonospora carbonacea TaxID=47853 RepID=A0A7D6CGP9_9ACTN|nr:FkbM family methyltransferase [Micromonospora sp. ATCC 39149]QLK01200.2 FkbM family methyltransferase [Micromonospora carbonacea]